MEEFLNENLIPRHVALLLELHGVTFIQDLYEFGEEDVKAIEESVRGGSIGSVDFNVNSNCAKFLGSENVDYKIYSFRHLDRKKLLLLSSAAKTKGAEIIDREKKRKQSKNQS